MWRITDRLLIYDGILAECDDAKMMIIVKINFIIIGIVVVGHIHAGHKIRDIIDCIRNTIAPDHFLETGNIRLVLIDQVDHFFFYFRVFLVFKNIKMFYVPAHYPDISPLLLHGKACL